MKVIWKKSPVCGGCGSSKFIVTFHEPMVYVASTVEHQRIDLYYFSNLPIDNIHKFPREETRILRSVVCQECKEPVDLTKDVRDYFIELRDFAASKP